MVLLLALTACRDTGGSADPAASPPAQPDPVGKATPEQPPVKAEVPAARAEPEPPAPPTKPEPELPAPTKPEPEPKPFEAEERIDVGGRPVAVRIDAQPQEATDTPMKRSLLVSIDGATQGDRLLSLPLDFEWCESTEATVAPVEGKPSPLVFAEAYCTNGEDVRSTNIRNAVIHVGDAATLPRVLWEGNGSMDSNFGVCVEIDFPVAEVPRAGMLLIQQLTETIFEPDRDLSEIRCRAKKARKRKLAEIAF